MITSKVVILVLGVLLLHSTPAWSVETDCTYRSSVGDYYDLSPLSKCDLSGYVVNPASDGPFQINVCNSVNGCGGGAAVCQVGQYKCGNPAGTFTDLPNQKGVIVTYTGGDGCPNGANRQSIFTFICDASASQPVITFDAENPQCTYRFTVKSKEACPRSTVGPQLELCILKVFLVPHTHDDVGWLMTVEDYYNQEVKQILDTTVASLQANPKRKFIYVEQAYFTLWWHDTRTTDAQRDAVKQFVKDERWEFIIGAWVMPDEACTTYGAVIDQMTLGHQFLLTTFGVKPTKGWQIDPFGASSVTPVLEKLAGFDAHLIDRITDKDKYQDSQRLEFYWRGSPSLGKKGEIFTEIMGGGGYCDWFGEFQFSDDPVNPSNVASYGQKFASYAEGRSSWYRTPNILAEWGCDFAFQQAQPEFHSMDQVLDWLQANVQQTRVNASYAIPSEYYNAVWKDAETFNVAWPNIVDGSDFLPYFASLWWTGYYTSRVQLKGYVRVGEATSHVIEPLYAVTKGRFNYDTNAAFDNINQLRVANGYAQHHDGVTGTSVPSVVQMYEDYLVNGVAAGLESAVEIINLWIQKSGGPVGTLVAGTDVISNLTNGQTVSLLLFNSLGWSRSDVIRIPVNRNDLAVLDANMNAVPFQISTAVGGNVTSKYHLFFKATLKGLSYSTYFIKQQATASPVARPSPLVDDVTITNSILSVVVSSKTQLISKITNLASGVSLDVSQNLLQYISSRSGAYAFGPAGPAAPISANPTTTISQGPLVAEIITKFPLPDGQTYAQQTIRINLNNTSETVDDVEQFIELIFDIGPLPSHIEVVASFTTSINSDASITSDDNGFEFVKRVVNWGLGIEANYFPLVYASYISDSLAQLSVVAERSHGVSTQINGEIEVMIHRNPDMGDGFGPGLTDTTRVFPGLRVLVDTVATAIKGVRKQSYLYNFPLSAFSSVAQSASNWANSYYTSNSLLKADLPDNVHFLSLNSLDSPESLSKQSILRLTHIYGVGEDQNLSKPATIDLNNLFVFPLTQITETTLSANSDIAPPANPITLNPKDIRTFRVQF